MHRRTFSACIFGCALLMLVPAGAARAEPSPPPELARPRALAVGLQADLFPTVISAVDGNLGYAPQIWVGLDHIRLRLVGAHLEPPDALAFADEGFRNPTTTALAVIVDYAFGERFDGAWLGAGFEQWTRTIEHEDVAGSKATWQSAIATVGGGYIWRISGNFYLDFWAALHLTLNPERVVIASHSYKPGVVIPSASIKVGYFLDL
jgi:hypothetical protein